MRKLKTQQLAQLAMLTAVTLVVQAGGFPQPVTGPLINALLFITTALLGLWPGIALGIMTPIVALIRGQLPAILAPMVPFIILSNAILVIVFCFSLRILQKQMPWAALNQSLAIVLASLIKYGWLTFSAHIIVPLFIGQPFPAPILMAMSLPQFITAIVGGALYLIIYKMLKLRLKYN